MTTEKVLNWLEEFWLPSVLIGAVGILLALLVWLAFVEQARWVEYAASHHCVQVGTRAGQAVTTGDGKVGYSSDQNIYRCDGGELIIR